MNISLAVIAHDIRSAHNVGALLRTCEGLGVKKVYFTGYTPHPVTPGDSRLPHIAQKLTKQIQKTSLGAEKSIKWQYKPDVLKVLKELKQDGYTLAGLEQTPDSVPLNTFKPPGKLALLLGREVEGIDPSLLNKLEVKLEIPMSGKKESFNVVEAASMAIYHCAHNML